MSVSEAEQVVSHWLEGHPEFSLLYHDESECRFTFMSSNQKLSQFYIVCEPVCQPSPDAENAEFDICKKRWTVDSDIDDVHNNLKRAREEVRRQDNISISDVLDAILTTCAPTTSEAVEISDEEEDENDDKDYYNDGEDFADDDAAKDSPPPKVAEIVPVVPKSPDAVANRYVGGEGSSPVAPLTLKRLCDDVRILESVAGKYGFSGRPREDSLLVWDVKLTDFPKGANEKSQLGSDLEAYARKFSREEAILLEVKFPVDYPMCPPFVRVLRPRFKFLTGHVTVGGSICMQMLTKSGWSPSNDMESILIQIRTAILSDPEARLELCDDREYNASEAISAFNRMTAKYGW